MNIWILISIALFLILLVFVIYLLSLKRELKSIRKELMGTRKKEYNRQLTVSLFDKDLTQMTSEINKNLDYQKYLKLKTEQAEGNLKQSVSDIAHDLRTPLTVVKGNLQMLGKDETLSEQNRQYLKLCSGKLEVLKTMVDDFFELSVLESDDTPVELSEVNATKLLMQFVVDHETLIREHELTPDIRLPEKSVIILADEQMISRMLSNLLNNVMKYAKESFILSMEIVEDGLCRITFSNQLCHDMDLEPEHLFDRTYRGNKARHGEGAGLGLYIVKLLAEKQKAGVGADIKDNRLEIHIDFPEKSQIS